MRCVRAPAAGLALATLLVALVPGVHAALSATVKAQSAEPITVNTGTLALDLTVTLDCQTALTGGSTLLASRTVSVGTPIALRPGLAVTGPVSFPLDLKACDNNPTGTATATQRFEVMASGEAEGIVPQPLLFNVTLAAANAASGGTPSGQALHAAASTNVSVAYRGLLAATLPTSIFTAAPGTAVPLQIQLTNNGNAPSTVAVTAPQPPGDIGIGLPPPVVLQRGEHRSVTVNLTAGDHTGLDNRETSLRFTIQPQSASSPPTNGTSLDVTVLLRVRSGANGAPLGLAGALAAVTASALGRRALRKAPR